MVLYSMAGIQTLPAPMGQAQGPRRPSGSIGGGGGGGAVVPPEGLLSQGCEAATTPEAQSEAWAARILAVARHGNLATLSPSERHVVARLLLASRAAGRSSTVARQQQDLAKQSQVQQNGSTTIAKQHEVLLQSQTRNTYIYQQNFAKTQLHQKGLSQVQQNQRHLSARGHTHEQQKSVCKQNPNKVLEVSECGRYSKIIKSVTEKGFKTPMTPPKRMVRPQTNALDEIQRKKARIHQNSVVRGSVKQSVVPIKAGAAAAAFVSDDEQWVPLHRVAGDHTYSIPHVEQACKWKRVKVNLSSTKTQALPLVVVGSESQQATPYVSPASACTAVYPCNPSASSVAAGPAAGLGHRVHHLPQPSRSPGSRGPTKHSKETYTSKCNSRPTQSKAITKLAPATTISASLAGGNNGVGGGGSQIPGAVAVLGSGPIKYSWVNQLTRIFLQEVPEDAPDKDSDEPDTATQGSGKGSRNNYCPYTNGKGAPPTNNSDRLSKSTHDSKSNTSNTVTTSGGIRNNQGCTATSSSSSGGVTSLSSGGLGNPFARQPVQPTWGNDAADSKRILAPSRLGTHSDTGNSTKPSVLRPSAMGSGIGGQGGGCGATTRPISSSLFNTSANSLSGSSTNKSIFKLKPSVLGGNNPFAKAPVENEDDSVLADSSTTATTESTAEATSAAPIDLETEEKSTENNSVNTTSSFGSNLNTSSSSQLNSSPSRNIFMPLARNGEESSEERLKSPRGNEQLNTGTGFVFGSNIHNKVTGAESNSSPDAATNGENSTGNLFSDAAKKNINDTCEDGVWGGGKSLVESSRELSERENANKRKFDEVEVITGEEAESNVLQMNCKLYAWINGTWQERGRGLLRLNDWDAQGELHSRLVIRTQGTLTVMLNTKVWSEMSVERASPKSVRFTALETDGQPKIFLVMGSPKDIDLLYNSLEWRVATSRSHLLDDSDTKKTKLDEEVPPLNV